MLRKVYSVDVPVYATAYIIADSLEEAQEKARALVGEGIDCEDREQVSGASFDDPDLGEVTFSPAMTVSSDAPVDRSPIAPEAKMSAGKLYLRPITRDQAHAYIRANHRHHGAPPGELWRHAVMDDDGVLRGVALVGRPVARELDDGLACEVTRMATDGAANADSLLYGAARRAADAKGYRRGLTYLLASEWDRWADASGNACGEHDPGARRIGGAGARAAGYVFLWRVEGRSWDTPSRRRTDKHPTEDKVALGWGAWKQLTEKAGRKALEAGRG